MDLVLFNDVNMAVTESTQVVVAERLNDGLVIKFNDGKCAFYSALLLYSTYPKAEKLDETLSDW